ncbi:hypothetical protein [Micromonospora craniellae]|uniref:Uncharacterized protein n=1 Tax=Micromonospora craniellae TaxID=2294034 RepID=A0A372G3C6_9ACTN|nr:hypothetical protein [Micromonospora craniellae]QOC91132.1 hypothetical protein ID554_24295 [Micromonospora craniellae]RFS47256.1 hypothetical protein D0Q02_06745 [Micromonospora craniellae]
MKIDDEVENRVRTTLHHVVKQQLGDFTDSVASYPDDRSRRQALELLVAVTHFVVLDAYGGLPTDDEVRDLAETVTDAESWLPVSVDEVEGYLRAVLVGRPLAEVLSPTTAVVLAFAVTGSLLSSRCQPDGEWWFNYLDKVEAAIEAAG